jgi:hypothetical protein
MTESKKWWQSKTIWGIIVAALGVTISDVFQVPGLIVPTDPVISEVQSIIQTIISSDGNVGVILGQTITVLGLIISVIGRVKAEKIIA